VSSIGGNGFATIYVAKTHEVRALNFYGSAPQRATVEVYKGKDYSHGLGFCTSVFGVRFSLLRLAVLHGSAGECVGALEGHNAVESISARREDGLKSPLFGLVILVWMALAPPPQSGNQATHDSDVQELERLETVWNEAHEHGDADALEALWADDLEIAVPRMQVLTKADAVKFAHSGRMKFLMYRTSNIHVRVYDCSAVVTGRLQRIRTINGQQVSDDWRFTKMYIREARKWRVVAFHASEGAQP
jgi:ketosteroid isomerase-like protein